MTPLQVSTLIRHTGMDLLELRTHLRCGFDVFEAMRHGVKSNLTKRTAQAVQMAEERLWELAVRSLKEPDLGWDMAGRVRLPDLLESAGGAREDRRADPR